MSPRRPYASRRGFTLVELMVALSAGLLLSASAFVLARQATAFFKAEASLGSAQFATMMGITRLANDLRRAGFMSSPHAVADPRRCGDDGAWPAGLTDLASLRIVDGGSVIAHGADHSLTVDTENGLNPDSIVIGQAVGSEHYAVQAMSGGGPWDIVLQNDGAMVRTLLLSATPTDPAAALANIFSVGRFLRLVDAEGRETYGVITGLANVNAGANAQVSVSPILTPREVANVCGCKLPCVGALVNPVARFAYDLRNVSGYAQYAGLYNNATHSEAAKHRGMAEPPRTELVRVELDATGNEIPDTLEVIAEYAVDLKLGVTEETVSGGLGVAPTLVRHPIGDPAVYTVAANNPERIRAVQLRLTTRVPRRDRDVALGPPPWTPTPADPGVIRFFLGANQGYARTRTAVTEVQMSNYEGW